MRKVRKVLAGALTMLSFLGNNRALGKDKIQNDDENTFSSSAKLSETEKVQGADKPTIPIRIINGIKAYKNPIIGSILGGTGLFLTAETIKEIARNGLFEGSRQNWLARYNYGGRYLYVDPKNKFWREKKEYDKTNRYKEFYLENAKDSGLGKLHGYLYDDSVFNSEKDRKVEKIIIVFGGTSSLGFNALDRLAFPDDHGASYSENSSDAVKNSAVICVDYPSYDESEGKRPEDEKTLQKYAERVLKYATDELQKKYSNAKNIEVYGYSLGGYSASWVSQFKSVKKVNLWSPVQLNSAVSYFNLPRFMGKFFAWLAFHSSEFDSIKNIKRSHKNCKINLFSGMDAEGDFLSIEHSVLEGKEYNWQVKAKEWEKMKSEMYGSKDWKKLWKNPNAKTDEENQKLKEKNKKEYQELFYNTVKENEAGVRNWQLSLAKASWRKLASENPELGKRLTVGCYVASHSSKHVFNIEKSLKDGDSWDAGRDNSSLLKLKGK